MSVVICHDNLGARAGGERVALALSKAFDDAPIRTLVYEPSATFAAFAEVDITTSWLNRSAQLRRHYRAALPAAALTWRSMQIDAEVVICSTSGLSHHVRTKGRKVVYCHTPARWLHDSATYLDGFGAVVRSVATAMRPIYRRLDKSAMQEADVVIANSAHIAAEVRAAHGLDAAVIEPPSTLDPCGPIDPVVGVQPGFVLSVTRPLGYKRLDVLVAASREMPDHQFVVMGDGPQIDDLRRAAPSNLMVCGSVTDDQLRWGYRNAAAIAVTCAEDFGLVPLEAAAFGCRSVAPDARGLRGRQVDGLVHYDFGSVAGLVEALRGAIGKGPLTNPDHEALGVTGFEERMREVVFG